MTEIASPVGMTCAPLEKQAGKTTIRLRQGDLTNLEVDAWVFYAREDLETGSGYGTAIQSRGGLSIKKELEQIGSIGMGEAVITAAGKMEAKHIIHACGPKFQEEDIEGKLRRCMESALKVAEDNKIKTLAFPPLGAGFYGVPLELCANVMMETIQAHLENGSELEQVIICAIDFREYLPFKDKFEKS